MSLRDNIACCLAQYRDWDSDTALADAILALVRAHLTSDEALERMPYAWVNEPPLRNVHNVFRAAITRYKQESGQ